MKDLVETHVQAANPGAPVYPVLPQDFVQKQQFELHKTLSCLHRIVNRWWENVLGRVRHDPRYLVRQVRATAQALEALADQIDEEIKKASIRSTAEGAQAVDEGAAVADDEARALSVGGEQPPLKSSGGEA